MGNFLTLVQPTSSSTDLYNYRGTGFVKLRNVSSVGTQDDVYTLTHTAGTQESITFTVTSASLTNVAGKTGLAFIIDTTLAINFTAADSLYNSDTEKYIKIGNYPAVKLISTFKNPDSTPTPRNPIMTTGAEYLVVYDGASFVVMNEAMMIDADTYNTYFSEGIRYMAAPTIDFMMRYVGEQINTRYTYLVCPPEASLIPNGAEYKANASATAITGTMNAGADNMYIIYLVLHNVHTGGSDVYDEWICINTGTTSEPSYNWEKIGNTDVNISHHHNIPSSGTHSHTMGKGGEHTHEVVVPSHSHTITSSGAHTHTINSSDLTLTPKFSTSTNGTNWTVTDMDNENEVKIVLSSDSGNTGSELDHRHKIIVTPTLAVAASTNAGDIFTTLSVPQAPDYSGDGGRHSHTIPNGGAHIHTMDSHLGHRHSFTYAARVNEETLILAVSTYTELDGSHSHTLGLDGSHTHSVDYASSHSHSVANGGTAWTRYLKITTSASSEPAGGHSHTIPPISSSEYLKLEVTGSGSIASSGSHSHETQYDTSHTLTTNLDGSHSHAIDNGGEHGHTTGQPIS